MFRKDITRVCDVLYVVRYDCFRPVGELQESFDAHQYRYGGLGKRSPLTFPHMQLVPCTPQTQKAGFGMIVTTTVPLYSFRRYRDIPCIIRMEQSSGGRVGRVQRRM